MKCTSCKGGEMLSAVDTYVVSGKNCVIIIKNVPCIKCDQCGEVLYSTETLEKIEEIVHSAEKLTSEITVLDYTKVA